jgi:integrase
MDFKIRNYREPSGQQNAVIVDAKTGLPVFWPTLYVSSNLRARGLALNTKVTQLNALLILYLWAELRGIDLEARLESGKGLSRNEIDSLVTLLRSRIDDLPKLTSRSSNVVELGTVPKPSDIWQALEEQPKQIQAASYNDRLFYIKKYVGWLCDYLSDQDPSASATKREAIVNAGVYIGTVLSGMKSVEPNTTFDSPKSLSNTDIKAVLNLVKPASDLNPWSSRATQIQNFAIVLVLLDTGLRSGELLSLKLQDIIFGKKKAKGLRVRRRQGDKKDPRKNPPATKRSEREVPLSEAAYKALNLYVTTVRNQIPEAAKTSYLFVSMSNSNLGDPLSALTSLTDRIRDNTGIDLTPHKLRHTATWRYCVEQKKQGKDWSDFVEQLCLKFGWSSSKSPTVRHYARRYLKDEMFEAQIRAQDKLSDDMHAAVAAFEKEINA